MALGAVVLAALGAGLAVAVTRSSGPPAARYGGIPSWLPKATIPVGRVVVASAARPSRAIEGDTVSVRLDRGRVLATAVGPAVPEEGAVPVPATSPCTFTVTFTQAAGSVPIDPRAFTIVDELGNLHHPRVSARGGGAAPARVKPGRVVMLTVYAVLPTGNGRLQWSPAGKPIVSWDFEVEID